MSGSKESHTILVAEDDIEVRAYLETALKCQGHTVEVSQDGEEVLSALENRAVPIAAIILDVALHGKMGSKPCGRSGGLMRSLRSS